MQVVVTIGTLTRIIAITAIVVVVGIAAHGNTEQTDTAVSEHHEE